MSSIPNALAQRAGKLPKKKSKSFMYIEPRQPDAEEKLETPPAPKIELDQNRKLKRLQRA